MLIGVDFDNTIVCYDQVFHRVATELGLIPPEVGVSKGQVRDHLRQHGQEEAWIELQGSVYGAYMRYALPFPGALDFFSRSRGAGLAVHIISHRTRRPFRGPEYDLHHAAQRWLERYGFFDLGRTGLTPARVHFELTKQEKLARIAAEGCTHFIDDLPEFLKEPEFPASVERILFDPNGNYVSESDLYRAASWADIEESIGCLQTSSP